MKLAFFFILSILIISSLSIKLRTQQNVQRPEDNETNGSSSSTTDTSLSGNTPDTLPSSNVTTNTTVTTSNPVSNITSRNTPASAVLPNNTDTTNDTQVNGASNNTQVNGASNNTQVDGTSNNTQVNGTSNDIQVNVTSSNVIDIITDNNNTNCTNSMTEEFNLVEASNSNIKNYLTNGSGSTLYVYSADTNGTSNCNGECLIKWPPALLKGCGPEWHVQYGLDIDPSLIDILFSNTGAQVMYKYMPLYTYSMDHDNSTDGLGIQDSQGTWYMIDNKGNRIESKSNSTTNAETN